MGAHYKDLPVYRHLLHHTAMATTRVRQDGYAAAHPAISSGRLRSMSQAIIQHKQFGFLDTRRHISSAFQAIGQHLGLGFQGTGKHTSTGFGASYLHTKFGFLVTGQAF
jgi:hypothetical protein